MAAKRQFRCVVQAIFIRVPRGGFGEGAKATELVEIGKVRTGLLEAIRIDISRFEIEELGDGVLATSC